MHRRRLLGLLTAALLAMPTTAYALGPGAAGVHVEDGITVSQSEEGGATGLEVLGQEVTGTDGDGQDALIASADEGIPADAVDVVVLGTEVDGQESSADALAVTVGGDDGVAVTAVSSERDGEGAGTAGLTASGGGESLEVLTTQSRAGDNEVAIVQAGDTRVGDDELGTDGCDIPVPVLIDGQMTCTEAGEEQEDAAILADVTVQGLSDATGLSVNVLRANSDVDATIATPPSPDPAPTGPTVPTDPTAPTGPTGPTTPGSSDRPDLPGKSKDRPVGGSSDALGAPASGRDELANAGAPALALLAGGLGFVGVGGALLRRRG